MGLLLNKLYQENAALQYDKKALQRELDAFKNGSRYRKIEEDHRKIENGYKREIKNLHKQLAAAKATAANVRDIWFGQCDADWESYQAELEKKDEEIRRLREQIWTMVRDHDEKLAETIEKYEKALAEKDALLVEKDAIIMRLEEQLAHEIAKNQRNNNNSSLPTSQTRPGQSKRIPNERENTGKPKGGQTGHKKSTLEKPRKEDINETVWHDVDENSRCPKCGSDDLYYTGRSQEKYELDIEIKVIRRKHFFYEYECGNCGRTMWMDMDPRFRGECTYGPTVQAMVLSLTNTANAAMNKVPMVLSGMTNGVIDPCDGYVAKLQKRLAKTLLPFYDDLRMHLIRQDLIYWDDTVIFVDKNRACFRFYGNGNIAFYAAHLHKDLEGLKEDEILTLLGEATKVMHDHNMVNYNELFIFINIECNQHLQRDAQRNSDDTKHTWSTKLKGLISSTIKDRNDAKNRGETCFTEEYIAAFDKTLDEILELGWKEYAADEERLKNYGAPFEKALLNRIKKYRENYFLWVRDFSIPTTNNLSERGLRGIKTKMKVSGQFESVENAQDHAVNRTYLETCRRNGINEMEALRRAAEGNPFTVDEIFGNH